MNASRPPAKISIAGNIGSGKSSVARAVAAVTGWPMVSTGAIFRQLATDRGLTVLELNRLAETDPSIDDEVDDNLRRIALTDDPVVIDSRMAWHFVPQSYKAYLVVDPHIAVHRVHGAVRDDERYATTEEAAAEILARETVEAERYRQVYGVDTREWRNYDLVIDTSHLSVEDIAAMIVAGLDGADGAPCRLSPGLLLPAPDATADGPIVVDVIEGRASLVSGRAPVEEAARRGDPLVACTLG